jgi:hypothetical protein
MKNKYKLMAGAVAVLVGISASVQATTINGSVTFGGAVTLGTNGTAQSVIQGANEVLAWSGGLIGGATPYVSSASGNLGVNAGLTSVTFSSPWLFGQGLTALWSYVGADGDTFTFNLASSTGPVITGSGGSAVLAVTGIGTITASGPVAFTATVGTWAFNTQNPSAGSPATFSFSAATGAVPDGGSTVMLLGAAMSGFAFLRKKLMA